MIHQLAAAAVAVVAGAGMYLVVSGMEAPTSDAAVPQAHRSVGWASHLGFADTRRRDALMISAAVGGGVVLSVYTVFGSLVPAMAAGVLASAVPVAGAKRRQIMERSIAADAWPRLLEELRLRTSSLGRSIPQALFEVGASAPETMRDAFATAHREWLMSTDFDRTLTVLKHELADPAADSVCETLLVSHLVGGSDLDRQLEALIDDRTADTQARKDARSRQAGARFSRRFVLAVPIGMALAGMSVGNGREAFRTPTGQLLTLVAIALIAGCWLWSGRFLRLPEEQRVFPE